MGLPRRCRPNGLWPRQPAWETVQLYVCDADMARSGWASERFTAPIHVMLDHFMQEPVPATISACNPGNLAKVRRALSSLHRRSHGANAARYETPPAAGKLVGWSRPLVRHRHVHGLGVARPVINMPSAAWSSLEGVFWCPSGVTYSTRVLTLSPAIILTQMMSSACWV